MIGPFTRGRRPRSPEPPGQAASSPCHRSVPALALETDLDLVELLEFGRAAAYMCTPYANLGHPPRQTFVTQLAEARAEWKRRREPWRILGNRK
ncbi:MAG: hypothetical protein C5B58_10880 [Acidobacteria bacterium]|nr:MAG: hypothetical protein C5B58_10880 [Acidobacteriota bacterium]